MSMDLNAFDRPTAKLVQVGLKALGFYEGTTEGKPGPKTLAAYAEYLRASQPEVEGDVERRGLSFLVADVAEFEVGVREQPMNSNRGERVEAYQAATWLDGTGWPWCAAFVCWCIREAAREVPLTFQRPRTAGAWDFIRWAEGEGLFTFDPREGNLDIRRGDIVVYTFSHIGIANETTGAMAFDTIEGNTDAAGSREGGGVYVKTRRRSQVRRVIRLEEVTV